jgi:DNA-binding NtrC family response regulator
VLLSLDAVDGGAVTRAAAALPDADLLVVATTTSSSAVRDVVRSGACDVVERAPDAQPLLIAVERAVRDGRNRRDLAALRARLGEEVSGALVGSSSSMSMVRELVGRAASSRRTVLVTGEAGSGKSTVARLVHDLSERAVRPYVVARCEGSDANQLETELFGRSREGLLERARGGTLVLDEFSALPRALHGRLASLLTDRVVHRADDSTPRAVDVRVILTARTAPGAPAAAPHELLGDRTVLPIAVPPLRERRRDIPQLVQHFRQQLARSFSALPPIGAESMTPLLAHEWPGNVRELEHWVARIALAVDGSVAATALREPVAAPDTQFAAFDAERLTLDALERRYILHVLAQENGHQSRAADRLGIDRRTLYRKLKEYRDDGVSIRVAG